MNWEACQKWLETLVPAEVTVGAFIADGPAHTCTVKRRGGLRSAKVWLTESEEKTLFAEGSRVAAIVAGEVTDALIKGLLSKRLLQALYEVGMRDIDLMPKSELERATAKKAGKR